MFTLLLFRLWHWPVFTLALLIALTINKRVAMGRNSNGTKLSYRRESARRYCQNMQVLWTYTFVADCMGLAAVNLTRLALDRKLRVVWKNAWWWSRSLMVTDNTSLYYYLAPFPSWRCVLVKLSFLSGLSPFNSLVQGQLLNSGHCKIWPQNTRNIRYCVMYNTFRYTGPFRAKSPDRHSDTRTERQKQ